jgi:hypothetical protein
MPARRTLVDFKSFMLDVRTVGGLVGKAAILAPPSLALLTHLGPPWPSVNHSGPSPTVAVSFLTCLVQLVVLVVVFQRSDRTSAAALRRRFTRAAVALAVTLLAYILMFFVLVRDMPDAEHKDVRGLYYTDTAKALITPMYTEDMALSGAGYDPTAIWVPLSVHAVRVTLAVDWLLLFASMAWLFGVFVVLQRLAGRTSGS